MNGRASPIGPELCVSHREVWGEALTGVLVGQVLSHVTKAVRDADAFRVAEGSTVRRAIASASPVPRGSEALARQRNLLFGNREVSWLAI